MQANRANLEMKFLDRPSSLLKFGFRTMGLIDFYRLKFELKKFRFSLILIILFYP